MTLLLVAAIVMAVTGWMVAGWSLAQNDQLRTQVERLANEAHLAQRLTQLATVERPETMASGMTQQKLAMPINRRLAGLR